MENHENHKKKKPLYSRDQSAGADKQYVSTDLFLCSCGKLVRRKWVEVQE